MLPLILYSSSYSSSHRQTARVGDRSSGGALLLRSGRRRLRKRRGASAGLGRWASAGPSCGAAAAAPGRGPWRSPARRGAARAGHQRCPAAALGVKARGAPAAWARGSWCGCSRRPRGPGARRTHMAIVLLPAQAVHADRRLVRACARLARGQVHLVVPQPTALATAAAREHCRPRCPPRPCWIHQPCRLPQLHVCLGAAGHA